MKFYTELSSEAKVGVSHLYISNYSTPLCQEMFLVIFHHVFRCSSMGKLTHKKIINVFMNFIFITLHVAQFYLLDTKNHFPFLLYNKSNLWSISWRKRRAVGQDEIFSWGNFCFQFHECCGGGVLTKCKQMNSLTEYKNWKLCAFKHECISCQNFIQHVQKITHLPTCYY